MCVCVVCRPFLSLDFTHANLNDMHLCRYDAEEDMHITFKERGGPFCADRAKLGVTGGSEWFVFESAQLEEVKGAMQTSKWKVDSGGDGGGGGVGGGGGGGSGGGGAGGSHSTGA